MSRVNAEKRPIRWAIRLIRSLFGGLVGLALAAAQCSGPLPPLPGTPSTRAPVRVAILTPMTGELATFGETVRNGMTMAFDEWNDRGGINGQFIQYVLQDTRCDPLEARRAAERAIQEQGARFLVGGVCSEEAIPIARMAEERGALFVAATATHPLVTVDGTGAIRHLVFRAGFAYPYQGRAAARFALDELHARRAAVLADPYDDLVRSSADEFVAAFVAGGGQVVATPRDFSADLASDASAVDLGAMIAEMIKAKPDVVYVPAAYPVANRVGSQVRALAPGLPLIGSEAWDNGALGLEALEGAYFTLHYSRQTPDPLAQVWRERYLSAFAVQPDTLAALGYDAASLLASGIEGVGSLSPDEVARSLEAQEFVGVTGRWRFDTQHNPLKPVVVVRIHEGDVVFYKNVQP